MKKIIYSIVTIILLGILTLLTFNYYKKNIASVYECKYNNDEDSQYYSLYNAEKKEQDKSLALKCQKKVSIKCPQCELLGNINGYEYNNEKLILLYNKKNKVVTIYNIQKSNIMKSIENVVFNDKLVQRRKYEVALYNDNKLIGFIFPNDCKKSLQCEKLYNLAKGQELVDEKSPEFWIQNQSPLSNPPYHMRGYNKSSITGIPNYTFITNITNGIIPVRTESGANLYNLLEEKYLNDFEIADIYAIESGFIYYHDTSLDEKNSDIIKYYNQEGKLMFTNNNNKFDIDDIEILQSLNRETLLVIGTKNSDTSEKVKIIDQEGNVKVELPISTNEIENDIKTILKTKENYNQLNLPNGMYNYLANCHYAGDNNSEIVITFSHQNNKREVDAEVTYRININTKKIIDKIVEQL